MRLCIPVSSKAAVEEAPSTTSWSSSPAGGGAYSAAASATVRVARMTARDRRQAP